jgi:hypothetical protein
MTELSPAAQAVLDAAGDSEPGIYATIAAALRAAADQVVPQTPSPSYPDDYESGAYEANQWARIRLLAIAAELDGTNTSQED